MEVEPLNCEDPNDMVWWWWSTSEKRKNRPQELQMTDLIQLLTITFIIIILWYLYKRKAVKKWSYPRWLLFPNFLPQWRCQQCQNQSWCAWMKKTFWRDKNTSYSVVPRTITKTLALSKKKENRTKSKFVILMIYVWSHSERRSSELGKRWKYRLLISFFSYEHHIF